MLRSKIPRTVKNHVVAYESMTTMSINNTRVFSQVSISEVFSYLLPMHMSDIYVGKVHTTANCDSHGRVGCFSTLETW